MYKAFGLEGKNYVPAYFSGRIDGAAPISSVVKTGAEVEMVPIEPDWGAGFQGLGEPLDKFKIDQTPEAREQE